MAAEPVGSAGPLSDGDRARLVESVTLVRAMIELDRKKEGPRPLAERVLAYLSNGFVLLLFGALISSVLVPIFQQNLERQQQTIALRHEGFTEFLKYSNSIWKEYYLALPLVHETGLNLAEYEDYLSKVRTLKLERYDAYARVSGLAVSFRSDGSRSEVERRVEDYAVRINMISEMIDTWLRKLYCAETVCYVPEGQTPERFEGSYVEFKRIQDAMLTLNQEVSATTELMIGRLRSLGD